MTRNSIDPARPLPDLSLPLNPERVQVVKWARQMIAEGCLILDTETVDLPTGQGGKGAEICEIALLELGQAGMTPVLCQHVKPSHENWSEGAIKIHGITPGRVRQSPPITDIWMRILFHVSQVDHLVIFNRQFDVRAMRDSLSAHGIRLACPESRSRAGCLVFPTGAAIHCALLHYSAWVQERKKGKPDWKWQKLPDCGHEAHSALGDCQSTADLIKNLASVQLPED